MQRREKMYRIHVQNARVGMVCAQDIYVADHLIVAKNTGLTAKNIARLKFYEIDDIFITEKWLEQMDFKTEDELSAKEKIYIQSVSALLSVMKEGFNDAVRKNMDVDMEHLFSMMKHILDTNDTVIRIFPTMRALKDMDDSTFIHSINVGLISYLFGQWLKLDDQELSVLALAGLLHDIGKLQIPKEIIRKPGKLTKEEYEMIKQHPVYGYRILKDENIDHRIKEAALYHHEQCNGSGYPEGLKSDAIPLFAKIVMIADVYDALTANRVYRRGLCPFDVIDIFETDTLHRFDAELITVFLTGIAETYMNHRVHLNDGREGKIILLNQERLARPVVQVGNDCIDLSKQPDIHIDAVLGE